MRAVQIALFVILIQVGMGLITVTGVFPNVYYESSLTNIQMPQNASSLSESEQSQASINIFNSVVNALTWGWIKTYFMPWYNTDAQLKLFVDYLVMFLNAVSTIVLGAAFIEFVRNRSKVL